MRSEYTQRFSSGSNEMHEKLRKDVIRTIESHGTRPMSDLPEMTGGERAKWFFWNMHENLDEFRKLEPTLIGQVMCMQLTLTDGLSMETEKLSIGKQIVLACRWHLRLGYTSYQNEEAYSLGDGPVTICVTDSLPVQPPLNKKQKGYLDFDNSMHPNQLFMYGWVTEAVWNEVKPHLYSPTPNCQTDLMLRDESLFPVRSGFEFVAGPPGTIGITNLEFCISSHSAERRTARRNETLQR